MQKSILNIAAILIITVLFSSCRKEDNSKLGTGVSNIIEKGSWVITLYSDNGKNETSRYAGFQFVFGNGNVTASKNGTIIPGSYRDSNDDSHEKLILNFGNLNQFSELNDDWHVIEKTSTKIRLEDVSGGNGGIDLLTFEIK